VVEAISLKGGVPQQVHHKCNQVDESGRSAVSSQVTGVEDGASSEFGANEWLVDEMYERYIVDKNSVDPTWWPILDSYKPTVDPTPTTSIDVVTPTVGL
jgi:2-oxoglutarate decarboxylase